MITSYVSQFEQVTARDRKGLAIFRCLNCGHSFTCSGKRRRIQHILGKDRVLGKSANIIPCPNPDMNIKKSLLDHYYAMECRDKEAKRLGKAASWMVKQAEVRIKDETTSSESSDFEVSSSPELVTKQNHRSYPYFDTNPSVKLKASNSEALIYSQDEIAYIERAVERFFGHSSSF